MTLEEPSGQLRGEGADGPPEARAGRSLRRAVSDADKASRRIDILSAAKHVFAERGYHATTIADIARQAGLSYGSIYWYYESKETLFHELMSAEAAALRAHINEAVRETPAEAGPAGGPAARIAAAVRATLEFYESDRPLVKLLFRDAFALGATFEEHLSSIQASFVEDAERLVVHAQQKGAMIEGPPRMMAFAITTLVGQLAHRRLTTDDGLSAAVAAGFVVELLLNGLRPRGAVLP
jgi:AcrR family transcriptional regulator